MHPTHRRDDLSAALVHDGLHPATRIDTPRGEIPAGHLREGDPILLEGGGIGIIKWIGHAAAPPPAPLLQAVVIEARAITPRTPRRPTNKRHVWLAA
jgi:hypothetical protein